MSNETGWSYDAVAKTWRAPSVATSYPDTRAIGNSVLPVGMIAPYVGSTAPTDWLLCDGGSFSSSTYPALAAVLGGTTTPNLKGKVIAGYDAGQAEFNTLKATAGSKTLSLAAGNLPVHTHGLNNHSHSGTQAESGHNHGNSGGSSGHLHSISHGHVGSNIGNVLWAGAGVHTGHNSHGGFVAEAPEPFTGTATAIPLNITGNDVANTGGDSGHVHGPTGSTGHTHGINGDTGATTDGGFANAAAASLPPYMTLNYIIKAA